MIPRSDNGENNAYVRFAKLLLSASIVEVFPLSVCSTRYSLRLGVEGRLPDKFSLPIGFVNMSFYEDTTFLLQSSVT